MSYTDIQRVDAHHNEWLNTLGFYKEDIGILTERLNEVAGKNTGQEAEMGMEHFENQFKIQQQNISDLEHRIKSNMHACATDIKQHVGKVDEKVIEEINSIKTDLESFEKNIQQIRKDFNIFLSKWM